MIVVQDAFYSIPQRLLKLIRQTKRMRHSVITRCSLQLSEASLWSSIEDVEMNLF